MPNRGVGAEGVVGIFRHEIIAIISDGFQILEQTFMQGRLLKASVQLQDILNEVVNFIVLELEIPEKMTRDTQKVKRIDGFLAGRR